MILGGNHNYHGRGAPPINLKEMIPNKEIEPKAKKAKPTKSIKVKATLHPRNKYSGSYDFEKLVAAIPELGPFVKPNNYGRISIDFFNAKAVKLLNTALLKTDYGIDNWTIPQGYLCPPIPGRADYVHHAADILRDNNFGTIPTGNRINVLDIGTGSNGILAMIGATEYGWNVVGSEIDEVALRSLQTTIDANQKLSDHITLRHQDSSNNIFRGVLKLNEKYDLTMSNPPFHASAEDSQKETMRKLRHLTKGKVKKVEKNFEGVSNELWCEGGELQFISNMIKESKEFATQVFWFSTLVSKHTHLRAILKQLRLAKASKVKTIEMGQGNKSSHLVAWTFLDKSAQQQWRGERWALHPTFE